MRQIDIPALYSKQNKIETINELNELDNSEYDKIFVVLLENMNEFAFIPEKIFLLKNLRMLKFTNSKITNVPNAIENLINLEVINFFGNSLLTDLPIQINKLEKLEEIFLPKSCVNYNFGGLFNLQNIKYDKYPHNYKKFELYHIHNNKIFVFDSDDNKEIPDTITHINCHRSLYKQLNNLPNTLEFFRTVFINKNINFPPNLKELHANNSYYTPEELKLPFNCKINIKNTLKWI